jgi:hypothetical protein
VLFDNWYASLANLKRVRDYDWHWLTWLKSNRLVNPDGEGNIPISQAEISPEGQVVHLKGYGFIKVFRTVSENGDEQYWASDLQMDEERGNWRARGGGSRYTGGSSSAVGLSGRKHGRRWRRRITFFMPCGHFCVWGCPCEPAFGMRQRCPLSGRPVCHANGTGRQYGLI